VGCVRGRTTSFGGAEGVAVPVAVALVATLAVGPVTVAVGVAVGSRGMGGVVGGCSVHSTRSAGEIIAALITTERTTSLIGDRPSYAILRAYPAGAGVLSL
jgi:hypothetical protein